VDLDYQPDGKPSRRAQLEKVFDVSGKYPPELREPPVPLAGQNVWDNFWEMGSDGSLSALEIEAWMTLTGARFDPWEVLALRRLDRVVQERLRYLTKETAEG
jgi:hypothetical protein